MHRKRCEAPFRLVSCDLCGITMKSGFEYLILKLICSLNSIFHIPERQSHVRNIFFEITQNKHRMKHENYKMTSKSISVIHRIVKFVISANCGFRMTCSKRNSNLDMAKNDGPTRYHHKTSPANEPPKKSR